VASQLVEKYMRTEHLPHIWCPGCGNGVIMHAVVRAIDKLELDKNKVPEAESSFQRH